MYISLFYWFFVSGKGLRLILWPIKKKWALDIAFVFDWVTKKWKCARVIEKARRKILILKKLCLKNKNLILKVHPRVKSRRDLWKIINFNLKNSQRKRKVVRYRQTPRSKKITSIFKILDLEKCCRRKSVSFGLKKPSPHFHPQHPSNSLKIKDLSLYTNF